MTQPQTKKRSPYVLKGFHWILLILLTFVVTGVSFVYALKLKPPRALVTTYTGKVFSKRSKQQVGTRTLKVYKRLGNLEFEDDLVLNIRKRTYRITSTIRVREKAPYSPTKTSARTFVDGKEMMYTHVTFGKKHMSIYAKIIRNKRGKLMKKPFEKTRRLPSSKFPKGTTVFNATLPYMASKILGTSAKHNVVFMEFPDDLTNPINAKPGELFVPMKNKAQIMGRTKHYTNYTTLTYNKQMRCVSSTIGNKFKTVYQ